MTTAVYRLDRTNTRATDPNDPTRIVQTGSQRTNGYELGINGTLTPAWNIAGGYAYQDAFVTSATAAARGGRTSSARSRTTRSRSGTTTRSHPRSAPASACCTARDMFATIDNTVTLPGYTRVDAAAFFSLHAQRAAAG